MSAKRVVRKSQISLLSFIRSSVGRVVKLLACGARGPGFDSRPCHLNFQRLVIPASKSRYGWKIAKSTLILKTTNQPTNLSFIQLFMPLSKKTGHDALHGGMPIGTGMLVSHNGRVLISPNRLQSWYTDVHQSFNMQMVHVARRVSDPWSRSLLWNPKLT